MQITIPFLTPADIAAAAASSKKSPRKGRFLRSLVWSALVTGQLLLVNALNASPTMADLRKDANLTPERLMAYFADFKFELGRAVQSPEDFLQRGAGDCDDFATLVSTVLREKGYNTRLVVVMMERDVHVVCYVAEVNGYLDYNRRKEAAPLVKCDAGLAAVATSVAAGFKERWRSASEFTYVKGERSFVETEFK